MRTALIHDWLLGMRGGEKVLEALCELFPESEIYTLLHDPSKVAREINRRPIHTSRLQSLPGVRSYYRYLLPLMPGAMESFDLSGYDLVVSSSHCVAKGARARSGAVHVCYCFTPMRYIYDQFENYFPDRSKPWLRRGVELFRPYLTRWDQRTAAGVDHFIAISEYIRRRIQAAYQRDASVVYPPVDTDFFNVAPAAAERAGKPYYLAAGALVSYKRVDLAIEACRRLAAPLKIIGVGNEEKRLRRLARGAPVEFLGWQSDEQLKIHYRNCEALLFPQEEDFGIAAVEAMACGKPVIAYGSGGALETVQEGKTGLFFKEQTADSLARAIWASRRMRFDPAIIRARAELFDGKVFLSRFSDAVNQALAGPAPSESSRLTSSATL